MTTIQVSLSVAFLNKEVRPGWNGPEPRARSFIARQVSIPDFFTHITSGNAWAVGTYRGDHRAKENFIQSQVMALDLDERSIAQAFDTSDLAQFAALLHQTPTHTPETPKTRVVFVLDKAIKTVESYERGVLGILHHYTSLTPDTSCKDAARYYYGCRLGGQGFDAYPSHRLPVEVIAGWVKEYDAGIETELKARRLEAPVVDVRAYTDPARAYAEKAYQGVLDDLRSSSLGERNACLFRQPCRALAMARGAWPGISEGVVLADMEREGLLLKLTKAEVEATLKSAQKTASAEPLILRAAPLRLPANIPASPMPPNANGHAPTGTSAPSLSTITVDDARRRFNAALLEPNPVPGFTTGIKALDMITGGVQRGAITTIVAETGSHKTQFCMGVAWNAMADVPILIMSMESSEYQVMNRLFAYGARLPGVGFGDISKGCKVKHVGTEIKQEPFNRDELIAIRNAQAQLRKHHEAGRFHIVDKPGMTDLNMLYLSIGQWQKTHGIGLIIWDGFGDIILPGMGIFDRTTITMLYAERIARDYDIAVLGTSQGGRNTKGRGNKVLGLQDAYGGSAVEFKSHTHMSIYDPWALYRRGDITLDDIDDGINEDEAVIRINKVRDGALGAGHVKAQKLGGAGFYEREAAKLGAR